MPVSGGSVLSTSIYSRTCWDCIINRRSAQAAGRSIRRNHTEVGSRPRVTRSRKGQIRSFHHGRVVQQEVAARETPQLPPIPQIEDIHRPIRQHLAKWQEENGNPMSDLLGLDVPFGVRNMIADSYVETKEEGSEEVEHEDEEGEGMPPEQSDLESSESPHDNLFLTMGDLVEIRTHNPYALPMICVYVRELPAKQIQLITMRGKWVAIHAGTVGFSVPGFLDKKMVEPVVPYLPEAEVIDEILGQTHILDPSVPRRITAPLVTALNNFNRESEEVYRKYASTLDKAHDVLAHDTDLRFGTLDRITTRLIGMDSDVPRIPAMYAVRKALLEGGMGFGVERRSHRTTGVFQIRSKEQLNYVNKAAQWLREYQEWNVSKRLRQAPHETRMGPAEETKGVKIVRAFVGKARDAIIESRKHRSAAWISQGAIGPSKERFPINSPKGTMRYTSGVEFNDDDRVLIRVIEYAGVQDMFEPADPLLSLLPIILRRTGMYKEEPHNIILGRRALFTFLLELGIFVPYESAIHYDVNLLLPSSQHSKPLQKLATSLEQLDRKQAGLKDEFEGRRIKLKGTTAFAIDDAGAHEIDDAISITRIPGTDSKAWVNVHIANPTAHFDRSSVIARMAAHLTESFYAPDRVVPLLPSWLTNQMLSLGPGRPCLTVSSLLDKDGNILDVKIEHQKLDKLVHIEYKQIPELLGLALETPPPMAPMVVGGKMPSPPRLPDVQLSGGERAELLSLYDFAQARVKYRTSRGGLQYDFNQHRVTVHAKEGQFGLDAEYPHRKRGVRVKGDPIIALHPSRFNNPFANQSYGYDALVQEMMLLAGEACSQWCHQRGIPIAYRTVLTVPGSPSYHEAYDSMIRPAIAKHGHIPVKEGYEFIMKERAGVIGTRAAPHPALGLSMYNKVTSPLRRYGDMITHWQIEAALREEYRFGSTNLLTTKRQDYLPFSREQMENVITRLSPRERLISNSKTRMRRHWTAHWFFRAFYFNEYPLPTKIKAIVFRKSVGRRLSRESLSMACWIDTGIVLQIHSHDMHGNPLQLGDIWEAEIRSVVPYRCEIILQPVQLIHRVQDDQDGGSRPEL